MRSVDEDLNDPGLTRLLHAARAKFQSLGRAGGQITIPTLRPDEAQALDEIWSPSARRRPRRGVDFTVALSVLDASLSSTFGLTLERALELTGGPLRLEPQQRAAHERRLAEFWATALGDPLCGRDMTVYAWVEGLKRTGGLGRQPYAGPRGDGLMAALRVGAALPRQAATERSAFAAEMLGDPHALDEGTDAGRLLVTQLAARDGLDAGPSGAGARRALLRRFGVLCDPASATVLTLGLRPTGHTPLEQALRVLSGNHVVLTLGQLTAMPPQFAAGVRVRLCENPAVVLRAESQLAAAAGPLICTGGWPGSAVCALLDALTAAGAQLDHHGDFDWEGLAIARWLADRYGVGPWRFDAADYQAGISAARARLPPLRAPRHRQLTDSALAAAMRSHGVAVSEEACLDDLVSDLGRM